MLMKRVRRKDVPWAVGADAGDADEGDLRALVWVVMMRIIALAVDLLPLPLRVHERRRRGRKRRTKK